MNAYSRIGVRLGKLASAALGGFAVEQLHAQVKPPVYFVREIDVSNPDGYAKEYLPKAREIIKAHGAPPAASGRGGDGRDLSRRILLGLPYVTDLVLYDPPTNRLVLREVLSRFDRFGTATQLRVHALAPSNDNAISGQLRVLREIGSGWQVGEGS